jgi:hypothetical protein
MKFCEQKPVISLHAPKASNAPKYKIKDRVNNHLGNLISHITAEQTEQLSRNFVSKRQTLTVVQNYRVM